MQAPYLMAEVSSNHNRDLDRCYRFIDTAAEIGCDAVKFQLFRIDELFAPEVLSASEEHRRRKSWELPVAFLPDLARRCQENKIEFSCTPFYLDAVAELEPYIDLYKISSYELLWSDLLSACAGTGKPVVLSTGMATLDEIAGAVETLREGGCHDLTLLHCVSGYPAPVPQCNLMAIKTLSDHFGCKVGWSDHSVSPAVINRAVHRWMATMVEFHLDLDGAGEEFAAGHCWLPEQIKNVLQVVKGGFQADGTGEKNPARCETADREWRADPVDGLRPMKSIRGGWRD